MRTKIQYCGLGTPGTLHSPHHPIVGRGGLCQESCNAVVSSAVSPCRVRSANCRGRGIVGRRLHPSTASDAASCTAKNIGSGRRRAHHLCRHRGERAETWSTAPRPNILTLRRRQNDNSITTTLTTIIECEVPLAHLSPYIL